MPLADLKRIVKQFAKNAEALAPPPPPATRKDIYTATNTALRPLIKEHGYRSPAEFENAYETQGEDMEWPKTNGGV